MKRIPLFLLLGLTGCRGLRTEVAAPSPDPFAVLTDSPVVAPIEEASEEPTPTELGGLVEVAQARIGDEQLRSFQFSGTPLPAALRALGDQAGISLYLDPRIDGSVEASFVQVTQAAALRALCAFNGLEIVQDEAGIYWIGLADGRQPARASFRLHSAQVSAVGEAVQKLVSPASNVVLDPSRNIVIVRGTRADVDAVGDYLESVDRVQSQVLLEVHIFEVSVAEDFALGLAHQFQGSIGGNAVQILQALTGADDSFQIVLDDEDGDLQSTLQAIQRNSGVELVSSPKVLVLDKQEASIEVIEEIPYVNVTSTQTTGDIGTSVLQQVEFKEVGVKLVVTPSIQEGGVMEVVIAQELSEVADFFGGVPVVDTRELKTRFLVEDRNTIVFGGLMQDRRAASDRGVPILMHIPLLGQLFKGNDDRTSKRELVVFLTARILTPKQAAALSGSFQDRYLQKRREYERNGRPAVD